MTQQRAEQEIEENKAEQLRQHNKVVVYGQKIELFHVYTGRFLRISTSNTSVTDSS